VQNDSALTAKRALPPTCKQQTPEMWFCIANSILSDAEGFVRHKPLKKVWCGTLSQAIDGSATLLKQPNG